MKQWIINRMKKRAEYSAKYRKQGIYLLENIPLFWHMVLLEWVFLIVGYSMVIISMATGIDGFGVAGITVLFVCLAMAIGSRKVVDDSIKEMKQ